VRPITPCPLTLHLMSAHPQDPGPGPLPPRSGVEQAGRGFVLVFVGALMFFGFVIGSELLGSVGQAAFAFVFASGALVYLWLRLDHATRRRLRLEARHWVRPSSRG
jgi:Flp pilus assembly protein TadB